MLSFDLQYLTGLVVHESRACPQLYSSEDIFWGLLPVHTLSAFLQVRTTQRVIAGTVSKQEGCRSLTKPEFVCAHAELIIRAAARLKSSEVLVAEEAIFITRL